MILKWLLIGLIAGTVAKMITPQDEGGACSRRYVPLVPSPDPSPEDRGFQHR